MSWNDSILARAANAANADNIINTALVQERELVRDDVIKIMSNLAKHLDSMDEYYAASAMIQYVGDKVVDIVGDIHKELKDMSAELWYDAYSGNEDEKDKIECFMTKIAELLLIYTNESSFDKFTIRIEGYAWEVIMKFLY